MNEAKLRSYLKPKDVNVSETALLIERANALESTRRLLIEHYNIYIPEQGGVSQKIGCPWRFEHKDGGKDKAMRYYFDTDTAFCFRDHGVVDPVFINSVLWGMTKKKTATTMLERAGKLRREHYSKRMISMLEDSNKPVSANQEYAIAALNMALLDTDYVNFQFKTEVISAKQVCAERFNPSWTLSDVEKWINASLIYIGRAVENAKEGLGHVV